jgi:hypothetical protein
MPDKLKSLIKSRRFWLAVLGVAAVVASDGFGLDHSQVMTIGGIVVAWIVGDAVRKTE